MADTIIGSNLDPSPTNASDPGFNIDFGALKAQASAMLDKAEADAAAPPAVTTDPTPDPTTVRVKGASTTEPAAVEPKTEPTATIVDEPATPSAVELGDDALVKVIVDGEEQLVPWKEARGKISGGLKFTQNMQQVAAARKALEADQARIDQVARERDAYQAVLNDKAQLDRYVQLKFGQQAQLAVAEQQTNDPNEIATIGQAQQLIQQQLNDALAQHQQTMQNNIALATAEIEHRQQTAAHAVGIRATLADIFTANPVLKSIPNAEDLIRYNVAKMNPQTEPEAIEAFRQVSAGIVEEIGKHFKAQTKVQAVSEAKQKLVTKTIEPATGAAPQLQPANYKNPDGTINWKSISQAASDMLG